MSQDFVSLFLLQGPVSASRIAGSQPGSGLGPSQRTTCGEPLPAQLQDKEAPERRLWVSDVGWHVVSAVRACQEAGRDPRGRSLSGES